MAVSDLEHLKALREADQRAVELLAKANADRIKTSILMWSLVVAISAVLVAIAALVASLEVR